MRVRLLKVVFLVLVAFAFFSCNNEPKDVVYQIQLDSSGATYSGTEKLYYNATNGLYYTSPQMVTPIASITPPKKEWTIRINSKDSTVESKKTTKPFQFGGYRNMTMGTKNPELYIGSDGRINKGMGIKSDITLTADWGGEDSQRVTVNELKNLSQGLIPAGHKFKGFIYNGVNYPYNENSSADITITTNPAIIDLDLEVEGGKTLILKSEEATKPGSKEKIFYKYEAKDGSHWFTSASWGEAITSINSTELPEKKYEIKLYSNNTDPSPESIYTQFPFMGYVSQSGIMYISPSGVINTPGLNDPITDKDSVESSIEAYAKFGNQTAVRLNQLSKNGYEFKGWSRNENYKNDGKGKLYYANDEVVIRYNEEEEFADKDNIIKLYAVWEDSKVYSLVLKDKADSEQVLGTIYYRSGDGWYNDEACTEKLTKLSIPKRKSEVNFYSGRSDISNPESIEYGWTFKGYKSFDEATTYISASGEVQNVSISSNTICYAVWAADKSIELSNLSESVHDSEYEFMGWSDDDGRTLINGFRYNVNETYGDSIVLVGIWKDKRVYTLTLDNQYSDGDVEADIQKLYYKPAATYKYEYSSESGKQERGEIAQSEGWYRDVDCVTAFTGFSAEEMPKLKYIVKYNINRSVSGAKAEDEYYYRFNGYQSYIDEFGNIIKDENGVAVRLASSDTALIKWKQGEGIRLPYLGQVGNETHTGWIYSNSGEFVGNPEDVYHPAYYNTELTPTWENGAIYKLTLNAEGATDTGHQESIFFKANDNKWYPDRLSSAPIEAISALPEKEIRVSFNPVESDTTPSSYSDITTKSAFLGYSGYIDANGRIIAASISNDVTAKVRWAEAEEIILPSGPRKDNLRFVAWCKDEGGEKVAVTSPYVPLSDIELYAKYENLNKYTLTLDSDGATEGTNSSISYWMEDSSWHSDTTSGAVINKINKPKKVWRVELDVNNSHISPLPDQESEFTFQGYKGADNVYYIDAIGNIVPGKVITNDSVVARAVWNEGKKAKLPLLTSPGFVFKGWTRVKDDASTLIPSSANMELEYTPLSNGERLYALWERESSYKLKLDLDLIADSGIEYYTKAIYYYKGDGWYVDENGTIKANSIEIPTRKYRVEFEPNLQNASKPPRMETSFEFKGYGEYITPSGEVNSRSSIASDVENLQAGWSDKPAFMTLPIPELASSADGTYEFVGWSTSPVKGEGRLIAKEDAEFSAYYPSSSITTLYGQWQYNGAYVLTLDNDGATNTDLDTAIYYRPSGESGEGWYSSGEAGSTLIDEIKLPKKEWRVNFITTGPDGIEHGNIEPILSKWEFLGYKDGNAEYILSNGKIAPSSSINQNKTVKALWGNQSAIDISRTNLHPSDRPDKYYFNGWALDGDDNNIVLPASFKPERDNVTLKAVWTDEQTYEVVLNNDGATSEGTSRVYYKPNDKKWHPESDTQTAITSITVPQKEWTIIQGSNKDGVENAESIVYKFNFEGYFLGDEMYIDSVGSFTGKVPTGDASQSVELTARWTSSGSVELSSLTKKGYTFLGWSYESTSSDRMIDNPYVPNKDYVVGKNINLYGVWKENDIYTLRLNSQGATSEGTKEIYYRVGDGWYKDINCTVSIKNVPYLPEKKYYVSYEPMLQGIERPSASESLFTFNGYNGYVLSGGAIIEGSSLTADSEADAQWVNQGYVTLPNLENNNTKYTFIGWCEQNPYEVDPEPVTNPVMAAGYQYKPGSADTRLYGYWKDNNIYALNLDDNGATGYADTKALYYRVSDGKWYKTADATGAPVTSINPPTKRITITFNPSAPDGSVTGSLNNVFRQWEFLGYEDYIDENGNIKQGAAINSDRTVRAVWGAQKGYDLDGDEGGLLPTNVTRSGFTFEGWTENKDAQETVIVVNPYYPSTESKNIDIRDGVITLYAVWRDESVIPLMLDNNGATSASASAVYYKVSSGKWYSTGNNPEDKHIITGIEIPKKEWKVNFIVSSKIENTPVGLTSRSAFRGYVPKNGTSASPYIDSNGIIQLKQINQYTTAIAEWDEPTSVSLPTGYTYPGWTFMGWSTTNGASTADYDPGATIKVQNNTVLYDVWVENNKYTLTLMSDNTEFLKIYYREGDAWYSDLAATKKITNITIPKKHYVVKFDNNGGEGENNLPDLTSSLEFGGFGKYINKNGVIVLGTQIVEDTIAYADWGSPAPITLPSLSSVKKPDHECVGWKAADDETIYTKTFTPQKDTVLYAQWVSTKAIKVTFVVNGATYSEYNRIYLREADEKWYSSSTSLTSIQTIVPPKKSYNVKFVTNLPSITFEDVPFEFDFGGYYSDTDFKTQKIDANGNISPDFRPTADTLLYAQWTPKKDAIDLTGYNNDMMAAAIDTEKPKQFFAGWSLYSNGDKATVLSTKDEPSESEISATNPAGLPVKVTSYTPTTNITLYAVLINTETYTITMHENTEWITNPENGNVQKIYYKHYANKWYVQNPDTSTPEDQRGAALEKALQYPTETIDALIKQGGYILKELVPVFTMPSKSATIRFNDAWPSIAGTLAYNSVDVPGYWYNQGGTDLGEGWNHEYTWNLKASGYYTIGANPVQFVNSQGIMDMDTASAIQGDVTLVVLWETPSDTWNKMPYISIEEGAKRTDTGEEFRYIALGWGTEPPTDDVPYSNIGSQIKEDYVPTLEQVTLYGIWFNLVSEKLTLDSGVDNASQKGTTEIYYNQSTVGKTWYYTYLTGAVDDQGQPETATVSLVIDGEATESTIVIPQKSFTLSYADSKHAIELAGEGNLPTNPASQTVAAKFLGYLNPDYVYNASEAEAYKKYKYIINERGGFTSAVFEKDPNRTTEHRNLDTAASVKADWGENSLITVQLGAPTFKQGTMEGVTFEGWSEIYGFDANGKIYFKSTDVPSGTNIVSYPYKPIESYDITLKALSDTTSQTIDKTYSITQDNIKTVLVPAIDTAAKFYFDADVTKPTHELVRDFLTSDTFVGEGEGKAFKDKAEQNKVANGYYWAGGERESITIKYDTTLYNVWAAEYTLAILTPQNLLTAAPTPLTINDDGVITYNSYSTPTDAIGRTLSYTKNLYVSSTGNVSDNATGALLYLVLLEGDGTSGKVSKYVSFSDNFTANLHTIFPVTTQENVQDADGGTFTQTSLGSFKNNESKQTILSVENKIVVAGKVRALAVRLKGAITGDTAETVALKSEYTKYILGGTSNNTAYGNVIFQKANEIALSVENVTGFNDWDINLYKIYTGQGGVPISWKNGRPDPVGNAKYLEFTLQNAVFNKNGTLTKDNGIATLKSSWSLDTDKSTKFPTVSSTADTDFSDDAANFKLYYSIYGTGNNYAQNFSFTLYPSVNLIKNLYDGILQIEAATISPKIMTWNRSDIPSVSQDTISGIRGIQAGNSIKVTWCKSWSGNKAYHYFEKIENLDITSWFTDLPTGITAKATAAEGSTELTITFEGTYPDEVKVYSSKLTIPYYDSNSRQGIIQGRMSDEVIKSIAQTIKFDIKEPTSTVISIDSSAKGSENTPYPTSDSIKLQNEISFTLNAPTGATFTIPQTANTSSVSSTDPENSSLLLAETASNATTASINVTLSDNSPFLDNSGNKITTAVLEITEGSSTATLKIGNSTTKVAPDLSLDYTDKAEVSVLGIPLGCLSKFKGYTGSATLLASVFYKVDKKLSFTALYGTNATESVLFASPGSSVNVQYMYIRPVLIDKVGNKTENLGLTVTTGTEFSTFSKTDSLFAFAGLWKDEMATVSCATSPSTVLNSPKLGDIKAVTTSSQYILEVSKVSTSLSESLYTHNEVFAANDINSAYNVRVLSDITVDDFYKFRPEPATYDDSGSNTKIAGTVNNSAKNEIATVTMSMNNTPVSSNLPEYSFDIFTFNGATFSSTNLKAYVDTATVGNSGVTGIDIVKVSSTQAKAYLRGTMNTAGTYTIRFKVGEITYNSSVVSPYLTVNLQIINATVIPDGKLTFVSYNGGYKITGTTATFTQGTTYVIPTTYNGKPVVAIDNGGLGSDGQNGVFNTDSNSSTGQVGNYANNVNLTSIILPNSITELGVGTFHSRDHKSKLKTVYLPYNLKVIPKYCFSDCSQLQKVVFPKALTTISKSAFYDCSGWATGNQICGVLPKTLTTIQEGGFGRWNGAPSYLPLFEYEGTKAEFDSKVTVGSSNYFRIKCSDGNIYTISK
ncbi:MAG: InlB B-repeat-containing protein [Sphaerochaetaceae bacterium]|nr:InlB B-repeat-containing protein [Sphaerochaetaceae bacterium]